MFFTILFTTTLYLVWTYVQAIATVFYETYKPTLKNLCAYPCRLYDALPPFEPVNSWDLNAWNQHLEDWNRDIASQQEEPTVRIENPWEGISDDEERWPRPLVSYGVPGETTDLQYKVNTLVHDEDVKLAIAILQVCLPACNKLQEEDFEVDRVYWEEEKKMKELMDNWARQGLEEE